MQVNKAVKKEFEKNANTVCEKNDANIVADRIFASTGGGKHNAKSVAVRRFVNKTIVRNTLLKSTGAIV